MRFTKFWWQLCLEELNHSAVYTGFLEELLVRKYLPKEILDRDLAAIQTTNIELEKALEALKHDNLSKSVTFQLALKLEMLCSENCLQEAMQAFADNRELVMVKKLLGEGALHKLRIEIFDCRV